MLTHYHQNPIVGVYYSPNAQWGMERIRKDIEVFAESGLNCIWLFFDPAYDYDDSAGLRELLDHAEKVGIGITPALGQFLQLRDHPNSKIVNADGTTSDDPRYWNMGCFRHPDLLKIATGRATRFFKEFADHPALFRIEGKPLMNFVHEAYYRNNVPEFGSGPMTPNCYCDYCLAAFRDYLAAQGLDSNTPAPKTNADPVLWQHWINCHAEAIPSFLQRLIAATKNQTPVWATHECNDFYPASWQSVHTGNDWWRMGAVLDFGHEDMYPLEFDTRYVCYVYDYAKDIMRSARNFQGLITGNGQAFNSWLGYQLPPNSMMEQIYSGLSHGMLGLVWWTELPGINTRNTTRPAEEQDEDAIRYHMIRQTADANRAYFDLVQKLAGYQLSQAKIALLYSWTTMSQELSDSHTYDTLLTYMLLVQGGYPVDMLSEAQVANGILHERNYDVLFTLGCAALPPEVHGAIGQYLEQGGTVIADYAPHLNDDFPPIFAQWRTPSLVDLHGQMVSSTKPRTYTLPDGTPIPVQLAAAPLQPPSHAEICGVFNDGSPAICQIRQGQGHILLMGSYLGWDYSNYPGYYDLGAMFPFHIQQDAQLRDYILGVVQAAGVIPPAVSSHPDVEVGVWHGSTSQRDKYVLLVTNHLQETVESTVRLAVGEGTWRLTDSPNHNQTQQEGGEFLLTVQLAPLQGAAYFVDRV